MEFSEEDNTTNLGAYLPRCALGQRPERRSAFNAFEAHGNADVVVHASGSENATSATGGFIFVGSCNGVPTGVPVENGHGRISGRFGSRGQSPLLLQRIVDSIGDFAERRPRHNDLWKHEHNVCDGGWRPGRHRRHDWRINRRRNVYASIHCNGYAVRQLFLRGTNWKPDKYSREPSGQRHV
jgi:hypothetical protein